MKRLIYSGLTAGPLGRGFHENGSQIHRRGPRANAQGCPVAGVDSTADGELYQTDSSGADSHIPLLTPRVSMRSKIIETFRRGLDLTFGSQPSRPPVLAEGDRRLNFFQSIYGCFFVVGIVAGGFAAGTDGFGAALVGVDGIDGAALSYASIISFVISTWFDA